MAAIILAAIFLYNIMKKDTTLPFYIGIDLGAGQGTKIGIFIDTDKIAAETVFNVSEYGASFSSFCNSLTVFINKFIRENSFDVKKLLAIGIDKAGILKKDGAFQLANNLPFLNNKNLKKSI